MEIQAAEYVGAYDEAREALVRFKVAFAKYGENRPTFPLVYDSMYPLFLHSILGRAFCIINHKIR